MILEIDREVVKSWEVIVAIVAAAISILFIFLDQKEKTPEPIRNQKKWIYKLRIIFTCIIGLGLILVAYNAKLEEKKRKAQEIQNSKDQKTYENNHTIAEKKIDSQNVVISKKQDETNAALQRALYFASEL